MSEPEARSAEPTAAAAEHAEEHGKQVEADEDALLHMAEGLLEMSKQAAADGLAPSSSGNDSPAEGTVQAGGADGAADDMAAAAAVAALAGLVPPSAAVAGLTAAAGATTPAASDLPFATAAGSSGAILPPLPGSLELPPLPMGGLFGGPGGLPFSSTVPFAWFEPQQLPPLPLPQLTAGKRARKPTQKYQEANDVLQALQQALQPASPDAEDTVGPRRAATTQRSSRGNSGSAGSRASKGSSDAGDGGGGDDGGASQPEPGSSGSDVGSEEPDADGEAGDAGDEPARKRRRVGKPRQKLNKPVEPVGKRKFTASEITLEILESEGCFDLDQLSAARRLGFTSPTTLKKEMARLGLSDWPYRTRATIAGIRKNLQRYVFEYGHKHCAPPTRTKIDALIAFVEEKEATVRANPKVRVSLDVEWQRLRQRLYKIHDEVAQIEASGKWGQRIKQVVDASCQAFGL